MSRQRRAGQRSNIKAILKRLEEDFSKEVSDKTKAELEKQANNICQEAKNLCPVDTGRLRDSIHVEIKGTRYDIVADAKDDKGRPYGRVVEFRPGTAARPFMIPAYDKCYKSAYDAILQVGDS